MSEFGCITNGRNFQEIATLYSTQMTNVFSGGLVYEYSDEGNGYGLVSISGSKVTPNGDFTSLEAAYKNTANPSGSGGATTSSTPSTCPPQSSEWEVANDDLPAMPSAAETFFKNGAGKPPGLGGPGSQSAGDSENESSSTVSGSTTSTTDGSSPTGTGAAAQLRLDVSIVGAVAVGLAGALVIL